MRISAVMAVRDGAAHLAEAIDTVLGQDRPPDEFIVVDDGSTDGTADVLRRYADRLVVLTRPPRGLSPSMNDALAHVTGDAITFQDSDDRWSPGRSALLAGALEAEAEADAAFGLIRQFGDESLTDDERQRLRIDERPQRSYLLQTALIRRSLLERVGGFDPALVSAANVDWLSRARAAGMHDVHVDAVVTERRIHGGNMGRRLGEQKRHDLLTVVRNHHRRTQPP